MIAPLKSAYQWFQGMLDLDDQVIGYDGVKDVDGRRRPVRRRVYPHDRKMRNQIRERAIATTQDLNQNFSVAAWAIRKHLDYVATMKFAAKTDDDAFNRQLETWMKRWSWRVNCDVRRKHPLRRLIRLAEARRTVDGDFFFMKIGRGADRGKLQGIEAYRIAQPGQNGNEDFGLTDSNRQNPNTEWINGVEVSKRRGIEIRYNVGHRTMEGVWVHDGLVPAPNMFSLGYYEHVDQVRGVSPLMAALNEFQDVYEGVDYMKLKLKISQLFAVATYRESNTALGTGPPTGTMDYDQDGVAESDWEIDLGSGPNHLDFGVNDKVEMIESRTPAAEQVDFLRFVLSIALKSLDLPDSFLREGETNFFGSRAALIQYLRSAKSKQDDLIEFLNEITRWRLGMAVADGELTLPGAMTFEDLAWQWKPLGIPWAWDPVKEATGSRLAIEAGIDSMERICLLNGTDPQDNIDERTKWNNYSLEVSGQPLVFSSSSTAAPDTSSEDIEVTNEQ